MSLKKRVLVVDDEPDITLFVKIALEQTRDYEVMALNEPADTVSAAREFSPDVILLDVMMPSMDGGDVASEIQDAPDLRHIPIVFLSTLR